MIVCLCNSVSDREIRAWQELGGDTFEALQRDLGVGTQCGGCCGCARRVLEEGACVGRHAEHHEAQASS